MSSEESSASQPGPGTRWSCLGLACLLSWTAITFFSRLIHYSTRNDISHLNSTYTYACCGMLLVYGVAGLLVPWLRRRHPDLAGRITEQLGGPILPCSAIVLAACTVTLSLVEHNAFRQPWCSFASTLAGCCIALWSLGWGSKLSLMGAREAIHVIGGAFIASALTFVVALSLPEVAGIALTALLSLVMLACYLKATGLDGGADQEAHATATPEGVFRRALLAVTLMSFAESIMRAFFLDVDPATGSLVYRWLFGGAYLLVAALLLVGSRKIEDPASIGRMNRVMISAFSFAMLLTPIVYGVTPLSALLPLFCFSLLTIFIWAYLIRIARSFDIAPLTIWSLGLGFTCLGCLAGTFLGSLATSFLTMGPRTLSLVALLCATTVTATLLFIADEKTLTVLIDADDERPSTPRRWRLRIEEAAAAHGLTAKETEVLMLAAKGRSAQRICEEMGLSAGTVNTHLSHIYKKLDVHDRQQLIDKLEGRD